MAMHEALDLAQGRAQRHRNPGPTMIDLQGEGAPSRAPQHQIDVARHRFLGGVGQADQEREMEVGVGALAVASGMAAAHKLGENTRAMLLTRSLAEMSRFAVHLGANPLTFLGLAGVGDLVATCSSPLSRNYQVGFAIGQGQTLEEIVEELEQTAEGINTIQMVRHKADELGIRMPLVTGLHEIIFNKRSLYDVVLAMMLGSQSSDVEFVLPKPGEG